jgi:glycosyltransferase involved in cell wall biosynthesis
MDQFSHSKSGYRILQIFNEYLEKGGEEAWVETLPKLMPPNFELRSLIFRSADWLHDKAPTLLQQAKLIGCNPDSLNRLRHIVAEFHPDLLVFHNLIPVASLGFYREARRLGIPVVQYIHNFRPFSPSGLLGAFGKVNEAALLGNPWPEIFSGSWQSSSAKTAVLAWHLWRLRRSGDLDCVKMWIAPSAFMRSKFIEAGILPERIELVQHCYQGYIADESCNEGNYYLYLGRVELEKGVGLLVEAWKSLATILGDACPRLVLAGTGRALSQMRVSAGESDRIDCRGFVGGEDKKRLIAGCRAMVVPSVWYEALGLVIFEAYAVGRPVIAAKCGGLVEVVIDSVTGWIHERGCKQSLIEAVLKSESAGSEVRAAMGSDGKSWLLDYGSEEAWRSKFQAVVEKLVIREQHTRPVPVQLIARPFTPEGTGEVDAPVLRVLQVFNQYLDQGGEEVWVNEVTALGNERLRVHDLRFLSRSWKGRGGPSMLGQAIRMWDNGESRMRLRREVGTLRPDALVFHNLIPVASFGLYDEARRLDLPVLQYVHNFRPFSPSGTMWYSGAVHDDALYGNMFPEIVRGAWEKSILRTGLLSFYLHRLRRSGWLEAVDRWLAVSEFMRKRFIAGGIPEGKIDLLRHCWRAMPEIPSPVGTGEVGHYLFLGRLVPEKGILVLLDSWDILVRRLGSRCPRLIVAGSGPEESEVISRCRRNSKVEFAGFVTGEAKQRLLIGCRALVAPSIWWEPLGLIIYEAYDYGKPVLAARSGGLMETVSEGRTGFLHEPGIAESLVESILRMEELEPEGVSELGRVGREWLLKEADPDAWRNRFLSIAETVILERNGVRLLSEASKLEGTAEGMYAPQ